MRVNQRVSGIRRCVCGLLAVLGLMAPAARAQSPTPAPPASTQAPSPDPSATPLGDSVFRLGEIVNVLAPDPGAPGVGGVVITREQTQAFDTISLDQAVNIVPGVSSTLDTNGRRNESNIFVRGFDRWQVPLSVDGVRIYLPADNRLDFARFLTADVAAVQIQKGYASVLDGPGGMGGAINLVTSRPTKPFQAEGSISGGGRGSVEGSNGYLMLGTRQPRFYAQGSASYADRDHWTLSNDYVPPPKSLQPAGERIGSDSRDWRANVKFGFTPTPTNEYVFNYTKQSGEKGAPLNVYNNPPVPPNSFWRWPYWDVQNTSILTTTQLTPTTYVKAKAYYNTFKNGLDAFDDITFTTQSANGRFSSPYNDHAYGTSVELGTTPNAMDTFKTAVHYRRDFHEEQQTSRPTSPTFSSTEPPQDQALYTWSIAAENTVHVTSAVDLVAAASYDKYKVTDAQEFNATRGLFELPKGGSDSFNWQAAALWRYSQTSEFHASVSDRARFPVLFELYSTRFGTATPNPDLGPERATNVEVGWKGNVSAAHVAGSIFYSNVRDLIQTVQLPDTTTQTQNVGTGSFYGGEISIDTRIAPRLNAGVNYTFLHRKITDQLQPALRPVGAPTHKAFFYAAWRPVDRLLVTPSVDVAGDRWSDMSTSPVAAFPYIETGAYTLVNLDSTLTLSRNVDVALGFKNLLDQNYELAWGFPEVGRTYSIRTRLTF